jgi:hypothetical protein
MPSSATCCKRAPHIKVKMVAPYETEADGEFTHAEWVRVWKIRIVIWTSPLYIGVPAELLCWWFR